MNSAALFGPIQGRIQLDPVVVAQASDLARSAYDEAERLDFSGDPVETMKPSDWLPDLCTWAPAAELAALGLKVLDGDRHEIVTTVGVDMHTDGVHGPVLCLVLHNDGLTFRQGRHSHRAAAGEWFVFDDSKPHGVRECRGRAVFVGWTVPLERMERATQP